MAIASFLDLCLDATSAERMEPFWAAALGYDLVRQRDGSAYLTVPRSGVKVFVNAVPEAKSVKNRVHLDVHCADVEELIALGAEVDRAPTDEEHWWSLLSPDGDEFCAFVRDEVPRNRLYEVVVDAADAVSQATWWADLLGGRATHEAAAPTEPGSFIDQVAGLPCDYLVFQPVPELKTVKNRVHWDIRADLQAVVAHGATVLREPVPGDTSWHVLADPEGNEFCVFPLV
jgi:hypothetical protein